jgi:hypothetical protein
MCEKKSSPKLLFFLKNHNTITNNILEIIFQMFCKCFFRSEEYYDLKKKNRSFGDDFFTHSKLSRNNNELMNQEIYGEKIKKTLEKEKLSHFYFRNFPNMF